MGYLGLRIKRARKQRSLSQAQLAQLLDVTQPTVGNWEKGQHLPKAPMLARIADTLEISRSWLTTGEERALPGGDGTTPMAHAQDPYFNTPILHVPVLPWPEAADSFFTQPNLRPLRHVAASIRATQPFALEIAPQTNTDQFQPGTIMVFDAARGRLHDGGWYLVNQSGRALLLQWHETEDAMANPPKVMARAILCLRELL